MSKGKLHIKIAKDISQLMACNGVTPGSWAQVREGTQMYLKASPNTTNWVSGIIYRKNQRDRRGSDDGGYHKKYLLKLRKILKKKEDKGSTPHIKEQLERLQTQIDE